jgi:hypothetical protein
MVQRNYSALVHGLKFYTDAMRRFVKQRLVAAFPNNWWEQGVMAVVSDNQRSNLRRDAANDPRRDKADLLEPYHFVPVVTRHFDRAFADVFHNYSKTRSLLQQVAIARNNSAHPPSGDMLADDVAHALYAVVQVLSAAQLPEAEAVENIRKDVMGIPEPAPPPPDSRFTPRPEPKTPLAEDVRRVVIANGSRRPATGARERSASCLGKSTSNSDG